MHKSTMEAALHSNFFYIQDRIEEIKKNNKPDIKMISDFQRYAEMQKHMVETIVLLRGNYNE